MPEMVRYFLWFRMKDNYDFRIGWEENEKRLFSAFGSVIERRKELGDKVFLAEARTLRELENEP